MRLLLTLFLLAGCATGTNGVRMGDRVRVVNEDNFLYGCIGIAKDAMWEGSWIWNAACIIDFGGRFDWTDCNELEVLSNDIQTPLGCPRR